LGRADLPLTLIRIPLFAAQKGHGFFVLDILRTIYDGNNLAFRTNGLTDPYILGNSSRSLST
jgi:hypothetical protein